MRSSFLFGATVAVFFIGVAVGQTTTGWPDTTRLLTHEKSQAKACVALLKSVGDKPALVEGQIAYESAKEASDGAIAGLTTVLVEGGRPEQFTSIQADMEEAGRGLKIVCNSAIKAARGAAGTKGLISEIVSEAVKPLIDALTYAAGVLWKNHVALAKLERYAAKWPEFGP